MKRFMPLALLTATLTAGAARAVTLDFAPSPGLADYAIADIVIDRTGVGSSTPTNVSGDRTLLTDDDETTGINLGRFIEEIDLIAQLNDPTTTEDFLITHFELVFVSEVESLASGPPQLTFVDADGVNQAVNTTVTFANDLTLVIRFEADIPPTGFQLSAGTPLSLLNIDLTTAEIELEITELIIEGELVPEPTSLALLGLAGLATLKRRPRTA